MSTSEECAWVAESLPEFLAGRVSSDEDRRVREHLEVCDDCRSRANAVSLLQQTPVPDPDPGRWEGFVDGVVDAADRPIRHGARRWVWISVAALLLLALVLWLAGAAA